MVQICDSLGDCLRRTKAVFLDLGDTLVYIDNAIWFTAVRLLHSSAACGISPWAYRAEVERLKLAHQVQLRQMASLDLPAVHCDADELLFWQAYFAALLPTFAPASRQVSIDQTIDYLAARTVDATSFRCFDDVLPTLNALAGRGVQLAIISNAHPSARRILSHLSLAKRFDCILLSNEVGYSKPSRKIYELGLARIGVVEEQALFIDDRAQFLQLDGGAPLPMQPVLVDRGYAYLERWPGKKVNSLSCISAGIAPRSLPTRAAQPEAIAA